MPAHASYASASGISAMMRFKADRRLTAKKGVNGMRHRVDFFRGGREPSIDELLNDPIVRALMTKDRTSAQEIRRLLRRPNGNGQGAA